MKFEAEPKQLAALEASGENKATSQPDLNELIESAAVARSRETRDAVGVILGTLAAWDEAGAPLVDFPGNRGESYVKALSTVPLTLAAIGRAVALMFVENDFRRPLIIGLVQQPDARPAEEGAQTIPVEIDGERLVFTADREIVFRCGEASITLTKAGKVLIRGSYLLSRSSGVNRVKGGSVQIN